MKKLNVNLILNELEKKFFEFFFFKEWCNIVALVLWKNHSWYEIEFMLRLMVNLPQKSPKLIRDAGYASETQKIYQWLRH